MAPWATRLNPNAELANRLAKLFQREGLSVTEQGAKRLAGLVMWEVDKLPQMECLCPCHLPRNVGA